jgi:ADP-ribose pyrophosphatase
VKPDATRKAYDGKLFDVAVETWGEHEREIVEHPGSVAVVAVDADGYVTLVRQLREPARAKLVELPAGVIDEGEQPLDAAKRELEEECGLTKGSWREVGAYWTSPGFLRERMTLFVAEQLERGEPRQEADESIELVRWHRDELASRLRELEDMKTLAGLLLYLRDSA